MTHPFQEPYGCLHEVVTASFHEDGVVESPLQTPTTCVKRLRSEKLPQCCKEGVDANIGTCGICFGKSAHLCKPLPLGACRRAFVKITIRQAKGRHLRQEAAEALLSPVRLAGMEGTAQVLRDGIKVRLLCGWDTGAESLQLCRCVNGLIACRSRRTRGRRPRCLR